MAGQQTNEKTFLVAGEIPIQQPPSATAYQPNQLLGLPHMVRPNSMKTRDVCT
jgi:hypothetical protein